MNLYIRLTFLDTEVFQNEDFSLATMSTKQTCGVEGKSGMFSPKTATSYFCSRRFACSLSVSYVDISKIEVWPVEEQPGAYWQNGAGTKASSESTETMGKGSLWLEP